jgi:hypothetical protein
MVGLAGLDPPYKLNESFPSGLFDCRQLHNPLKEREPEEGFEQYSVSSVSSCSIAFIDLCAAKEPSRHSRERGNDKQNLLGGSICCSSQ